MGELMNMKKEYDQRIESLLAQISEKEQIIEEAEKDGFIMDDNKENDSENYSDSADVTDDDMPPLIDAHQQTIAYFGSEENVNNEMSSQITERNSINHNVVDLDEDKLNEDNNDDNNEYEMVDAVNSNDNKSRDETPVAPNGDNPNLAPSNIEKMVSNSPSPNLTPSASQQRLD